MEGRESVAGGAGQEHELDRWEAVLRAERSVTQRVLELVPGARTGAAQPVTLEERELAIVQARTWLGRALRRSGVVTPGARRPLLDREVDVALRMLAHVPFEELQERGWDLQPNNFYCPLNDVPYLRRHLALWTVARTPRDIEWALDEQLVLAAELSRTARELRDRGLCLVGEDADPASEHPQLSQVDVGAYAGLVGELRPQRIVQVGAGWCTAALAGVLEALEHDPQVAVVGSPGGSGAGQEVPPEWLHEPEILQRTGTALFDALGPGDILFYDGSHSVRVGGDLNWMLFKVLPRLVPGVWIHFHDLFWPCDYPAAWVLHDGRSWNEQYVLQAFLMRNDSYRVRLALAMLAHEHPAALEELGPGPAGTSLWLEKRGPALRPEPGAAPEPWLAPAFRRWLPRRVAGGMAETAVQELNRWERLLSAERSVPHRLAELAGALSGLGRPSGVSLEAREARIAEAAGTRLGRVTRRRLGEPAEPSMPQRRPHRRPRPGPLLSREIDRALSLLSALPFEELQERGWHLQPTGRDSPLNAVGFLRRNPDLWAVPRLPAGIDWDLDGQEALVRRLAWHATELDDVPDSAPRRPGEFAWRNGVFEEADAYIYYGLLRELAPARVVEVGVGWSSTLLARALGANHKPAAVTLVDPGLNRQVLGDLVDRWRVIESEVQLVDPAVFEELRSGDVLFYDGSHCVHTGSDVNWMLFEVLPRLADGVWVHFHDIFWPHDYFAEWVLNDGLSWNEQYALEAFLSHNDAYRVRIAVGILRSELKDVLGDLFRGRLGGGSVWIEKAGRGAPSPRAARRA